MRLKIFSFFFIFTLIFFSCKKDDQTGIAKLESPVPVLSKVTVDKKPNYEYSYNDAHLISQEKSNFDFTVHNYNLKNQLITSEYYIDKDIMKLDLLTLGSTLIEKGIISLSQAQNVGTLRYEYNSNNQLTRTSFVQPTSSSTEYSEFSYDGNNRISRKTLFWDNKMTGYIDYSYDSKGNLVKESLFNIPASGIAELSTTSQYVFDNQNNPYRSFSSLMVPGIHTNRNNIIKETLTIRSTTDPKAEQVQVIESTYEYNTSGYPVRKNSNIEFLYI